MIVIAGFFTGGALAVRGGVKAARNSAIGCACLLAIIEGVGIGLNRVMAANNVPQNPQVCFSYLLLLDFIGFINERHANDAPVGSCRRRVQRSERQGRQRCQHERWDIFSST